MMLQGHVDRALPKEKRGGNKKPVSFKFQVCDRDREREEEALVCQVKMSASSCVAHQRSTS